MKLEKLILNNLVLNEEYARKVIPHLKPEYFQNHSEKLLYEIINEYVNKYNGLPSTDALTIELNGLSNVPEEIFKNASGIINDIDTPSKDIDWLLDQTESFCQDKAIYNAVLESIKILDGNVPGQSKGAIPQILQDALGVSFDSNIGHDFLENAPERHDFYQLKEKKLRFGLDYLNRITKGGVSTKTLNIILAGTGVGKSMAMGHFAADNLADGKNVLYITLEMAEERIAQRIDANLLNVTMDELQTIPKKEYLSRIERVKGRTPGKLIIKEYPPASVGAAHFRHLLNELRIKKNFKPDVIYIDYLNLAISSRMKYGANVSSYLYVKAVAEELRGLAVEYDIPVWSATQTTRSGYSNSDVDLEDTSESFGLPATCDFMVALISTEELESLGQILVKQLKNRYNDKMANRRFVVGVDRSKMKLFDVEQEAQDDIVDDRPIMDKTNLGERLNKEKSFDFSEFK